MTTNKPPLPPLLGSAGGIPYNKAHIDSLHDEIQFMRKAAKENRNRADRLTARLEAAEKALEPFANEAAELPDIVHDDFGYILEGHVDLGLSEFTVGDCRRAKDFMKEAKRHD